MKSLASGLLHVASGILKDVQMAYPAYGDVVKDIERLTLYSSTRGSGLFVLDLPSLDTILLDGLERGRLVLKGPLTSAVSKRVRVPRLFAGLWLRVFDSQGMLKPDVDVNAIMFLRQLFGFGKRIAGECSPKRLAAALREYHYVDGSLSSPTLAWDSDEIDTDSLAEKVHLLDFLPAPLPLFPEGDSDSARTRLRSVLNRIQQVADLILNEFDDFDSFDHSGGMEGRDDGRIGFRHGPGAVAERTGVVDKYDFQNWSNKLEGSFQFLACGTYAASGLKRPRNHEVASRLQAVPKTAKAPRLIASEPTENQWCQQLMLDFLVTQLKKTFGSTFIDFTDQSKSGEMALRASRDRKLATIDLSSASDRLSCRLIERIFRGNSSILKALHASRTRYIRDNISPGQPFLKLRKFASQGTAVTFPVQTLTFLCIVLGCNIRGRVTWSKINRLRHRVRVFGDDLIVPSTGYADVVEALETLELKVNGEKSFVLGSFRESCGTDAWNGYDVTPCRLASLTSDGPGGRQSIVDTANNLFKKGYWHASVAIESLLPSRVVRHLPVSGPHSGFGGRLSFCGPDLRHLYKRYNERFHRTEYKVWGNTSRRCVRPHALATSAMLQRFTEAADHQRLQKLVEHDERPSGRIITRRISLDFETSAVGIAERVKTKDGLRWEPLYGPYTPWVEFPRRRSV